MSSPNPFVGVWARTHLFSPSDTLVDTSTTVLWLQSAGGLFVDIRIPTDASAYERIKGFAGMGAYDDHTHQFTWTRWMDYQPPSATPDVGLMTQPAPQNPCYLVEDGVNGDDYREYWQCEADTYQIADCEGLQLPNGAIWVRCGSWFGYACDQRTPENVLKQALPGQFGSLKEALDAAGVHEEPARRALAGEMLVCVGKNGVVQYSTQQKWIGRSVELDRQTGLLKMES